MKRIISVLATVVVLVAMLTTPALATSKKFDCYNKDRDKSRFGVTEKRSQHLEERGFKCHRVHSE